MFCVVLWLLVFVELRGEPLFEEPGWLLLLLPARRAAAKPPRALLLLRAADFTRKPSAILATSAFEPDLLLLVVVGRTLPNADIEGKLRLPCDVYHGGFDVVDRCCWEVLRVAVTGYGLNVDFGLMLIPRML